MIVCVCVHWKRTQNQNEQVHTAVYSVTLAVGNREKKNV